MEVEVGTRMLRVGEHLAWMAETPERIITDGDADAMQAHLDQHGCMLVRGLIERDAVRAGCRCLAEMLAGNGWLAPGAPPVRAAVQAKMCCDRGFLAEVMITAAMP